MWFDRPLTSLTDIDLRDLVTNGVAEGQYIDFKNELPAPPKADKDKKSEFLVDVSSLANSGGGTLIYGIAEGANGIALGLQGVGNIDRDGEENRLRSYLQTGLDPQLPVGGMEFHAIAGFTSGTIILIRVARSWAAPHMVVADGKSRGTFHVRDGNRNRLLEASGVRAAMLRSKDVPDRIRAFRDQRMTALRNNNDPVAYRGGAKVILHLISLDSFDRGVKLDARFALQEAQRVGVLPFSTTSDQYASRYNIDGAMLVGCNTDRIANAYVQLYRGGMIEAVDYRLLNSPNRTATNEFPTVRIEGELIKRVPSMIAYLKRVQLRPPFMLMVSFAGIAGYFHREARTRNAIEDDAVPCFDRAVVELPELVIEADDLPKPITATLEPLIHDLWQAGGAPSCPRYNNGVYTRSAHDDL